MPTLYLFDIDGTIADMTPAHVAAYKAAYKKVLGLKISEDVLVRQFGQVERDIHKAIFSYYGIKDKSKIKPIIDIFVSGLTRSLKTTKIKVLPGVKQFLSYLERRKQPLGIVTGNSKEIGEAILKKTKLYRYFGIYSYGNVSKRAHIVRNAIRAAKRRKIGFDKVVVIGDSPFDVHAAKKNRTVAIAVATGRYTLNELKAKKPDFALKSLRSYKALVREIERGAA